MEGYKKALADHGLRFRTTDIVPCSHDGAANQRILQRLLLRKERPDGVIATVERLATGIYQACQELRLSIPGQVKVVAFSNLPSAMLLKPSLTTVTQPAFEMGKAAATLLFKALTGKQPPLSAQRIVIPSVLQVRNSSGGAPAPSAGGA